MNLFRILFSDRSSLKFSLGVCFGLSFSMATVLGTIGLMDGFEVALKKGLQNSLGDLTVSSHRGFFLFDEHLKEKFKKLNLSFAPHIQTEGFVIKNKISKGVLIRGISPKSFNPITKLNIRLKRGTVGLGSELAESLQLSLGDELLLAFARGNQDMTELPLLQSYKISSIVHHGLYFRDLRSVYMDKEELAEHLNVKQKINIVAVKLPLGENIDSFIPPFEKIIGDDYSVLPYWSDFKVLLDAVAIEKLTISLILQVIVVISIFNVLAFIVYLHEKRGRELFLLRAFGLSQKQMISMWTKVILLLWFISCLLSIVMVNAFNELLAHWSLFELPGEIYYFGRLRFVISLKSYAMVFLLALAWPLLLSSVVFWHHREKTVIQGLRRGFV